MDCLKASTDTNKTANLRLNKNENSPLPPRMAIKTFIPSHEKFLYQNLCNSDLSDPILNNNRLSCK